MVNTIAWYLDRKKRPKFMSQGLRFFAVVLITVGGLFPILGHEGRTGYALLAIGGAFIALDKFWGFSSGWMRNITTVLKLQQLLAEFQMDWAILRAEIGGNPTPEQERLALERLKTFRLAVWREVQSETQTWTSEFKNSLAQLDRQAQATAESVRPASLSVKVTGAEDVEGLQLLLDGVARGSVENGMALIKPLAPGAYSIAVTGTRGDSRVSATEVVVLGPGEFKERTSPYLVTQPGEGLSTLSRVGRQPEKGRFWSVPVTAEERVCP